jgi:porin
LFDKRLDIAAGRMNVENDFASSPLYCNFLNNALCGDPKALPGGDVGHSAYPDAVWAARLRVRPTSETVITVGAYEVNQGLYTDRYDRSGFALNTSRDSGVYLPVQLGFEPKLGRDQMPGHYVIGMGYDSSAGYQDFGDALAAASVPGAMSRTRHGNTQVWALADQMLRRQGPGTTAGVIALVGFVHNDPANSVYAEQYFAGVVDEGFWKARPLDTISLLVSHNTVSGRLGNVQGIEQALGLPYSNGATGIQSHETIFEANYNIHVLPGLTLQPDVQYVARPNGQSNIRDALVLGCRAHLTL